MPEKPAVRRQRCTASITRLPPRPQGRAFPGNDFAGTHATCGFDVYIGTTSVGQALTGTQAAAVTTSVAVGSAVTSLQAVEVKSLTDATGKAVATYEFVNSPGASFTS